MGSNHAQLGQIATDTEMPPTAHSPPPPPPRLRGAPACPQGALGSSPSGCPDICPSCRLVFQILGEPKQNRKLVAEASLRNPLTTPLLGCTFTMEGAGLMDEQKIVDV